MKKVFVFSLMICLAGLISAQQTRRFSTHELSINGFRNPSIGLEYRYRFVSVHGGLYLTNFVAGETTRFLKTGATFWFLPVGKRENPSSFYLQLSYLRGLNRAYAKENAFSPDLGFRWMVWKGLNLRVGAVGVFGKGKSSILWTPGIGYAVFW
ncbi:MAG: hypothetical protein EAZ89_12980 [Bacteroidetes bacterium]|nr:MAG: hypothetical protein EAZ89_12980 [Bacteroidota bacterium]